MPSGFVDRYKGKIYQPTGALQQVGSGGAVTLGGGQINSTSAVSTSGGILSSGVTTVSTIALQTIPAKTLDRFGRNLLINAWGVFSTANAGVKSANLVFGSVTAFTITGSTAAAFTTPQGWFMSASISCNSTDGLAAKQSIWAQGASTSHAGVTVSTGTENMLLNSTVKVTAQSSAGTAGDITLLGIQIEGLN
jgi:hypothetical protein